MAGPSASLFKKENADLSGLVKQAIKEEMAVSLIDLLVRRLQISITPSHGFECLKECADIMAAHLGWTDTEKELQISQYKEEVGKNMNF